MDFENLIPDLELPEIDDVVVEVDKQEDGQEKTNHETVNPQAEQDEVAVAFYEQLKERGYTFSDEFNGTWEEIDDYFNNLPQAVLNSVVESLPDLSKDVVKFVATAGQNITKDELKDFFVSYFQDIEDVTLDSNDNARDYLEDIYKKAGMRPKSIQSALDALEDDDELIATAKEEYEKNKQIKSRQMIEQKDQENKLIQQQQKEFMSNIQKELTTSGWKQERVQKISSVLSGDSFSNKMKEIVSNPKSLVQLADLLTYYENGEFNLEHLKKQVETKTANSLKDALKKNSFSSASLKTSNSENQVDKFDDDLIPILD